jgi:hypothetical protein
MHCPPLGYRQAVSYLMVVCRLILVFRDEKNTFLFVCVVHERYFLIILVSV